MRYIRWPHEHLNSTVELYSVVEEHNKRFKSLARSAMFVSKLGLLPIVENPSQLLHKTCRYHN